jgi:hypothetical protein
MRKVLPVLFLLSVAACTDVAAPPTAPVMRISAGFPPGKLVDTIQIRALDRLPLREAVLVAPNGSATPANYVAVDQAPQFETGQRMMTDPWQTSLLGQNGANVPLAPAHALSMAAYQGRETLLATASTAEIPLPDPVAYRRDWTHYRIRLTFGTPPDTLETREIAAPEPPPPGS